MYLKCLVSALLLLSTTVLAQQPRVAARLLAAPDTGGAILGLELSPDPGWHTYWQNPGDAGLAPRLRWTTPPGVGIGPILWPSPQAQPEGDLLTYGYDSAHTLLNRVQIEPQVPDSALLELKARWLVCKDICIPESGEFAIRVGQIRSAQPAAQQAIRQALQALPEELGVTGVFGTAAGTLRTAITLPPSWLDQVRALHWFPAQTGLIEHAAPAVWHSHAKGLLVSNPLQADATLPERLQGVLVIEDRHGSRAIEVALQAGELPEPTAALRLANAGTEPGLTIWLALLMAFAGGLILNLMPCVFPVLTLKALSLSRAESLHVKRMESLAYAAGVVLSFLLIAAILLGLRAGGAALGWGFQLQNPAVVGALAVLMMIMGLAMLGWTQLGMRFMGWGQNLAQHAGLRGAFFTGVLAVLVASPCSAPFMGGALGYAVLQPAPLALSIFAALGLGLAAPFVTLAWIPAFARRLPRPGPWMERIKHWMALPLFATGLWLLWVLWRQTGSLALALILLSIALLALGIRQSAQGWNPPRPLARLATLLGLALIFSPLAAPSPERMARPDAELWQTWTPELVAQARQAQRMVFVDYTADWCLSCIVNERAVLASTDIQALMAEHNTLLLKADWTQYDSRITASLAEFGRNGVPLYLLYPPDGGEPEVLPQILTPQVIRNAYGRAVP